jgi:lipoyl synthase
MKSLNRKPEWLKIKYRSNKNTSDVDEILRAYGLNTVCEEAMCPNRAECFSKRVATFMILGKNCTRRCTFCNVSKELPCIVDPEESMKVALAAKEMGLVYVVITSVTRDDLPDGGASHFASCIEEMRIIDPDIKVEVLIPDFMGDADALKCVVDKKPFVLNHNIETVERLYPEVRPQAAYQRSLELLRRTRELDKDMITKSGIMLGLGETRDEVLKTLRDLIEADVKSITIGQYLAPSKKHHEVMRYVEPSEFEEIGMIAKDMGFIHVASAPFVRSSYNAAEIVDM